MQIIGDVCHEDVLMLSWRRWTDEDVLILKTLEFVKKKEKKSNKQIEDFLAE